MFQGGAAEKKFSGGGGYAVERGKGLPGLQQDTRDGHIFQINGAGIDGFG